MTTRAKWSRRTILVLFTAAVVIVPILILFPPQFGVPRVTVTFLDFADTLRPHVTRFSITNHSSRRVHLVGYRFVLASSTTPYQAHEIQPGESAVVALDFPDPVTANVKIELVFRRPDTAIEEGCEMLDSVLRSFGIRLPGLNPDSTANLFRIRTLIPVAPPPRAPDQRRQGITNEPTGGGSGRNYLRGRTLISLNQTTSPGS